MKKHPSAKGQSQARQLAPRRRYLAVFLDVGGVWLARIMVRFRVSWGRSGPVR